MARHFMFASFENRWLIVFASMFGLMATAGTVNTFGFAVFLKPVSEDLGLSRSVMASGLLVSMLMCGVATPFMGCVVDRWGSRNVLLPGIPLFALTIAALSLLEASLVSIYALFALAGLLGSAQNTVPYAAVISKWFDRQRGFALAIAMTGYGLGIVVVPQVVNLLIQTMGWRWAYVGLGATVMVLAFVPVLLFVREPSAADLPLHGAGRQAQVPGLTAKRVFTGEWRFYAMSAGFFIATVSTHGAMSHMIALLTDRGISQAVATAALSTAGGGVIAGRIACGWCLDRFHGPHVAASFFVLTALGISCLISGATGIVPLVGALLCGIGLGGQAGLMAFFASRYFGLKAYGTVFGTMFGMILFGSGVGPFLGGLSFDLLHSYQPAMIAFAMCLLGVSVLFLPLGPYPFGSREAAKTVPQPKLPETAAPAGLLLPVPGTST
jgi:MFS family permease